MWALTKELKHPTRRTKNIENIMNMKVFTVRLRGEIIEENAFFMFGKTSPRVLTIYEYINV